MPTILLVEDETALRCVLSEYLAFYGYDVVAVPDGEEALLRACAGAVDVVVSDVLLPGIDGLELCNRFRADERLAEIPFLFMTARNVDEQLRTTLAATGAGSVFKPFEPTELLTNVRDAITRRERVAKK
ncbi:MAG: response regulator [Candidatus Eremiobacteraeota bacterium]|nr:response regulator [Candidatus Eremiobacteraeota bacterium]